jgi:hypothetical protein
MLDSFRSRRQQLSYLASEPAVDTSMLATLMEEVNSALATYSITLPSSDASDAADVADAADASDAAGVADAADVSESSSTNSSQTASPLVSFPADTDSEPSSQSRPTRKRPRRASELQCRCGEPANKSCKMKSCLQCCARSTLPCRLTSHNSAKPTTNTIAKYRSDIQKAMDKQSIIWIRYLGGTTKQRQGLWRQIKPLSWKPFSQNC